MFNKIYSDIITEFYKQFLFVDTVNLSYLHIFMSIFLIILLHDILFIILMKTISIIIEIFKLIFNPIIYFVLLSSGYLTYLLYSLLVDRNYEIMFLTYAFITISLLMFILAKPNN